MKRLELAVLAVGILLMGVSLSAFDWRLGLFFAGFGLAASAIDIPRTRA